jgi:hypothetical protein
MGVGVVLWVVGNQFLVEHVHGMLPSSVTDPSMAPSDVPVLINHYLHYFLWVEIPRRKGDSL